MSSDPSLNPDHPLHGFEYIASNKKGDMYKKNDEFYYLTVACVDGKKEGKAEMKSMNKDLHLKIRIVHYISHST